MHKRHFTLIALLIFVAAFAQSEIDYEHPLLKRSLNKAGIQSLNTHSTLGLSDSLKVSENINGKFFIINETSESQAKYIYVGRVNSCRSGGCSAPTTLQTCNSSEYFEYYILFDTTAAIQQVKVFNYQATHGQEVSSKGWLKQFIGYDGSAPLKVNKDVDAIAGATISTYAITEDVNSKTSLLKNYLE